MFLENNKLKIIKPNAFEHTFFASTAILFLALCLVGFSMGIQLKSSRGTDLAVARFLLHGTLGFIWLLTYVLQTQLIFRNKIKLHMKIGRASVITLFLFGLSTIYLIISAKTSYPKIPDKALANFIGTFSLSSIFEFALIILALWFRKTPFLHKRLMFYGVLAFSGTGTDRIFLFMGIEEPIFYMFSVNLLIKLPLLIYDFKTYPVKQKLISSFLFLYSYIVMAFGILLIKPYFSSKEWINFAVWLASLV
ncbi:hypothetical protein [Aestuariibaculum marinum]|uniref:Uncharacterized protein n=1 Tax=Aestuariibaculum marinum TaxID=2683592 RepID=A0A8J6Q0P6_9FLAO|nr:hypothetical protein [Aestuariibaculum marinum]MBD0822939.1 hypothetical protein [Aestuariibaculum marinum]